MRIIVEEHKCVGAGQCVSTAPELFDQNEESGIVILLEQTPAAERQASARAAARLCPALAIHIDEE